MPLQLANSFEFMPLQLANLIRAMKPSVSSFNGAQQFALIRYLGFAGGIGGDHKVSSLFCSGVFTGSDAAKQQWLLSLLAARR